MINSVTSQHHPPQPKKRRSRQRPQRRRLVFESLENRCLLAADPTVALSMPSEAFIGSNVSFTATFDNTASPPGNVGYGPFIDLVFPVNGVDGLANTDVMDGLDFISATYLGVPVTTTVLTFPGSGVTSCVDHPYAVDTSNTPLLVCGAAGDKLVVLQLPFGSFTPDQPTATVSITANMSNFADLGEPLTVAARGGFQFGNDPLNNPSVDPTLLTSGSDSVDSTTWVAQASVTPTVMTMSKAYNGPEDETATGPNFPRQYTLTVNIAPGQTVTNLDIIDGFDNNIVVTGINVTTSHVPAPINIPTTPFGPANFTFPSQALVATIPTVTGTGDGDVVVTIDFYVPEFDANGDRIIPIDGEDDLPESRTLNDARAQGDWDPLDPRDPTGVDNAVAEPDPVDPDHVLDNKSIAIQKSVAVVGGGDAAPGQLLEYTLSFQISDYYTFGDFVITDTFSDGQDFLDEFGVPYFTPTFTVSDRDGTTAGTFTITLPADPGDDLSHTINVDGTETLVFDLSQAMQSFGDDGILIGGLATEPDDFSIPPVNAGLEAPAIGTVTFRVFIPDTYDVFPPSGSDLIAQGDSLGNEAEIAGTVRDNDDPDDVIGAEDDDTSAGIGLPVGSVSKSIYAVNGVYPPPANFTLAPGDELTYRIRYTLPFTSFINFSLNDFLPLPVFNVMDPLGNGSMAAWTFNVEAPGPARDVPPAPGVVEFGPNDTLYDYTGASAGPDYFAPPQISTNANANSLTLNYGSYNSGTNISNTVDLLFTITASNRPFADGLFLTNIVRALESDSELDASVADSIIQFPLGQPALGITKGVVATDHPAPPAEFVPAPVGPAGATFQPPGSSPSFTGTVTSSGLSANPIDSNLTNVDAGNLVTFAIVVENTGSSRRGAFDVRVRDTLPTGFRVPTAGESAAQLNLQVRDGTGAVISFIELGGTDPLLHDLFEDGIELVDPGPTPAQSDGTDGGALDQFDASSGRNILVITYDLIAETSVQPRETIVNTATLTSYAGVEGGENHVPLTDQPFDEAEVTIAQPTIDKTIIDTNQTHTVDPDVAIGEIITYQVVVTVPEGTTNSAVLVDVLDSGLAFVDIVSITASPDVSTDVGGGFGAVATNVAVANVDGGVVNDGRQITLDFGTITNANTNDAIPETITVTYRAVVLNSTNNNRGDLRNNLVTWQWENPDGLQTVQDGAPDVRIVEPTLVVLKEAVPQTGQAGDVITFTIEVRHDAGSAMPMPSTSS
jgi:large repetitive protein